MILTRSLVVSTHEELLFFYWRTVHEATFCDFVRSKLVNAMQHLGLIGRLGIVYLGFTLFC